MNVSFEIILSAEEVIEIKKDVYDIINEKSIEDTLVNNYYLLNIDSFKILTLKNPKGYFKRIHYKNENKISPKDSRQSAFMHSLESQNILLNVCLGQAGTGKTTLAASYALDEFSKNDKKIFFSKTAITVGRGRAFGPVPGDINQKYAPYLDSFKIVLKKILGNRSSSYIDAMLTCGNFNFQPIEFVRGNTYENCTFILDEVQNLTWHELKTVISRMGEGCKLILIGDPNQRDLPFTKHSNGLNVLINSNEFRNSPHTSIIELQKQYRGPLADLIYKIDLNEKTRKKDRDNGAS